MRCSATSGCFIDSAKALVSFAAPQIFTKEGSSLSRVILPSLRALSNSWAFLMIPASIAACWKSCCEPAKASDSWPRSSSAITFPFEAICWTATSALFCCSPVAPTERPLIAIASKRACLSDSFMVGVAAAKRM